MKNQIIAIAIQKGGTGKTTSAVSLSSMLAGMGFKVLLVDVDPQSNATKSIGVDYKECEYTVYDVILNTRRKFDTRRAIMKTAYEGIDLLPSTLDLAGAEIELGGLFKREYLLREALDPVRPFYDYILIDCPPSLGLFTLNALMAADTVYIPLQAQALAFDGLEQLKSVIEMVRTDNKKLSIGGIFLTMFDTTTSLSKQVQEYAKEMYGELVLDSVIRVNTVLAEAPAKGEPISVYAPRSRGAVDYFKLAKEVVSRGA